MAKLRLKTYSAVGDTWDKVVQLLVVPPPYQIMSEAFPDPIFNNYYEILRNFTADSYRAVCGEFAASDLPLAFETGAVTGPPDDREQLNGPYLKWLFTVYRLPVERLPVLDIGCGGGFLARAALWAGASRGVATDLRLEALRNGVAHSPPGALTFAMADMFSWSYPPGGFAFVALRNNSAHTKIRALDARFEELHRNWMSSLAPGGIGYLSAITSGTDVPAADGCANHSVTKHIACLEAGGAHILRLLRTGTGLGFVVSPSRDAELVRRTAVAGRLQRERALTDFFTRGKKDPEALRNLFLALCEYASEIALAHHTGAAEGVLLWGTGLLTYYTWRLLNILHPELRVVAPDVPDTEASLDGALLMIKPQQVEGFAKKRLILAVTGMAECGIAGAPPASPSARSYAQQYGFALLPLLPDSPPQPEDHDLVAAVAAPDWTFHYLSGDQDCELPGPIATTYLDGPLKGIDGTPVGGDFEERFRFSFPLGWAGVG